MKRRGFTLIELLVVVAIIALLIGILLPSLGKARERSRTTVCLSRLKGIGTAMAVYSAEHDGLVVPSYNFGPNGDETLPLDGWAPIFDRDGLIPGRREAGNQSFYCPNTLEIEGMAGGMPGLNPDKPRGWFEWPSIRMPSGVNAGSTIPDRGFDKIIRVSYWINSANQFGGAVLENNFYTLSVGYKQETGELTKAKKTSAFKKPHALIAVADGVYAGRQENTRLNGVDNGLGGKEQNSRIGYRHVGNVYANAAFADGHAESIHYSKFPRKAGGPVTVDIARVENMGEFAVFADPAGQ